MGTEDKNGGVLHGKYELGRQLGHGTFAKVYHARNVHTGRNVAMKVVGKDKVIKVGMMDQIKREISVMKMVRHPNIVELYEVMASRSKIYFAMELVRGGELFAKIAKGGRLREEAARSYFQQLISALDFCHSRRLITKLLDPNPSSRITISKIMESTWFRKSAPKSTRFSPEEDGVESKGIFEEGFDLSPLFEEKRREEKEEMRFATTESATAVVTKLEEMAKSMKFSVKKSGDESSLRLQGHEVGRKGKLGIAAELFAVTPSFLVVEVKKSSGDTLEYNQFCSKELRLALRDIVWRSAAGQSFPA